MFLLSIRILISYVLIRLLDSYVRVWGGATKWVHESYKRVHSVTERYILSKKLTDYDQETQDVVIADVEKVDDIAWDRIDSEDTKKWFEYKEMWTWWGGLFDFDDIPPIEDYMRQIGEKVGLKLLEKHKSIAERVRDYLSDTSGWFELHAMYKELHLDTLQDKGAAKIAIKRERDKGFIEKHGQKSGVYRKPDYEVEEIDWINADDTPAKIIFPLDLHEHVSVYVGDVIVIAGKWNAGKSAWLMETARLNLDIWLMDFLTSEMKGPRFKKRMRLMRDHLGTSWEEFNAQVRVRGREGMFHDVVDPKKLTFIDYLQINEEFYRIGANIKELADKLDTGIIMVAIQKDAGSEYGYGGQKGMQRATLYLTIDDGVVKIVKAKDWTTSVNPNGKIQHFKLYQGVNFQAVGALHHEGDNSYDKELKKARGK